MEKPQGYDEAEAKTAGGDFPQPTAGGYVAKIVSALFGESKKGNKKMLTIGLDIAEGDFKDHYTQLSEKFDKDAYLKIYQLTEGDNVNYFKGLIAAIEHSNQGFKFDFDEKKLIGKKLGINLREEEYLNKDNVIKTIMKVAYHCSAEEARAGLTPLPLKQLKGVGAKPQTTFNQDVPSSDGLPF